MIKAVIFDMDGVIIDSEIVYMRQLYDFLKKLNKKVDDQQLNELVGLSKKESWEKIRIILKNTLTESEFDYKYDEYLKDKKINYDEILNNDVISVLKYLKKEKYKIGLASSSSANNIKEVITECKIKNYFDIIVSGDMFEKSKPHPEIYEYTVDKLQFKKEECIIIEDSVYGIQAGINAGIEVIAKKDNRFNMDQSLAKYKINELKEVISIIEKINLL